MSDLRPTGAKIEILGVERHLLFTLNAIDSVESEFDKPTIEVLQDIADGDAKVLRKVFMILANDEVERNRFLGKDVDGLREITEKEAGWLVSVSNRDEVVAAILLAFGISMPEADEDDGDDQDR